MAFTEKTVDSLLVLIRCAITGEKAQLPVEADGEFGNIIKLARLHEVSHLAAYVMLRDDLIKDENNRKTAERLKYEASYRDTKNNYTYDLAIKTLNAAKIPFVPLKGAIVKPLYPERWMRSSCDTDILVHKSDFDRAVSLFTDLGFTLDGDLQFHDVSLLYDDSNLELHFSICENIKCIDSQLKKVWDNTRKADGFMYLETRDYYVFHHIAHMSYHLLAGGCGIRPFVDFYILCRNNYFYDDKVSEFCKNAKIYDFYNAVKDLTKVWFEDAEHNEITKKLQRYTVMGGAYGYFPNNAAAYTVRNGGKVKYLLSLALPPYSNMRVMYPALNKRPFMLPAYYCYRLFQKTIGRSSNTAKQKYNIIKGQDSEFVKEVASLIKALNLDKK